MWIPESLLLNLIWIIIGARIQLIRRENLTHKQSQVKFLVNRQKPKEKDTHKKRPIVYIKKGYSHNSHSFSFTSIVMAIRSGFSQTIKRRKMSYRNLLELRVFIELRRWVECFAFACMCACCFCWCHASYLRTGACTFICIRNIGVSFCWFLFVISNILKQNK